MCDHLSSAGALSICLSPCLSVPLSNKAPIHCPSSQSLHSFSVTWFIWLCLSSALLFFFLLAWRGRWKSDYQPMLDKSMRQTLQIQTFNVWADFTNSITVEFCVSEPDVLLGHMNDTHCPIFQNFDESWTWVLLFAVNDELTNLLLCSTIIWPSENSFSAKQTFIKSFDDSQWNQTVSRHLHLKVLVSEIPLTSASITDQDHLSVSKTKWGQNAPSQSFNLQNTIMLTIYFERNKEIKKKIKAINVSIRPKHYKSASHYLCFWEETPSPRRSALSPLLS